MEHALGISVMEGPIGHSLHAIFRWQQLMPDTTSTPPSQTRAWTHPFGTMMQACLAWYRRHRGRPEKANSRPNSDSTLVPNTEIDDFSVKMGSIPVDSPGLNKWSRKPLQPAVPASHTTEPQRCCKYSSELDRRKWGELQPQVVPSDMVLERIKLSDSDSSPLRGNRIVTAHG